jgi:hypothetical protein
MKMRTVYFKVFNMDNAVQFWSKFLLTEPTKRSPYWSEFRCESINLGLLWIKNLDSLNNNPQFVPVFEVQDFEIEIVKNRALALGAQIVVDVKNHPDQKSYVLSDPFGNEFEITYFHD